MRLYLESIGAWGEEFSNWPELRAILIGECGDERTTSATSPKPEIIPANERRRAPLSAKLAVEVCLQSMLDSAGEPISMPSVFCSGLGDTDLTEYMCRELTGEAKQLSPTKFHNSVHNAPAGYWTIATGCHSATTAVAGLYNSVAQALLEGLVQSSTGNQPVLVVFYDTPVTQTLQSIYSTKHAFAASFVLRGEPTEKTECILDWKVLTEPNIDWPAIQLQPSISDCYQFNMAARILAVLHLVAQPRSASVNLPLSSATALNLRISKHVGDR